MDYRTSGEAPRLPFETILDIVNSLPPTNPDAILPSSHEITKTLVALTTVCWATYPVASRLLYQHCMYIDSNERVRVVVENLAQTAQNPHQFLWKITKLFLSPFLDLQEDLSEGHNSEEHHVSILGEFDGTNDNGSRSSTEYLSDSLLDDLPTATAVRDLLVAIAPTLRLLVIDMPLRGLHPEDDRQGVRPLLREGFSALANLEKFVSVRDELYLNVIEHGRDESPVWATCWPKLRFLTLYNLDFDSDDIWSQLVRLPHLQMAIFARADGSGGEPEDGLDDVRHRLSGIDIKKKWFESLALTKQDGEQRRTKNVTLVFADCSEFQPDFHRYERSWRELDPQGQIRVLLADVPEPDGWEEDSSEQSEICPIELTQDFLKRHALEGTLWDENATGMRNAATRLLPALT